MESVLIDRRGEIAAICRRRGVRRLELIGSAARDDFDASRSDIDFLVEFDDDIGERGLETYLGLREELAVLLGRRVDLVMPQAVRNPFVRASFARDRKLVYAA